MYYFLIGLAITIIIFAIIINNPHTKVVRKINTAIIEDRSICDFICTLDGWDVTPIKCDATQIIIRPLGSTIYYLYITYHKRKPYTYELRMLYDKINEMRYKARLKRMTVGDLCAQNNDDEDITIFYGRDQFKDFEFNIELWYRIVDRYGVGSTEEIDFFKKHVKLDNEWRMYLIKKMRENSPYTH